MLSIKPQPLSSYGPLCDTGPGILHTTCILYQLAARLAPSVGDIKRRLGNRRKGERTYPFPHACSSVSMVLMKALHLCSRGLFPVSRFFFKHSQNQLHHVFSKITTSLLATPAQRSSPNSTWFLPQASKA